ncbi:hypothetical protein [Chryseobacterium wangxinyae]|uniref:hypothetical protein n=1 Tax=Chryseobacterium sp. CY353 TaxID=2997334 RepID=UPI00226E3003|nr:hypothetical protein [Chryseobacterium sp. CY353]MCY0968434.1 hypothetical protein [Chryseobacterium sp. CY353]
MKIFRNYIAGIAALSLFITLNSCALRSVPSDYSDVKIESVDLSTLGNGKILIYNGASILHSMDNTARLNFWINKKPVGQIRTKEYVIIDLSNGIYEFNVLHLDMVNMRSNHSVSVNENTKVIRIEPTITSNKLTVTNVLPQNFEKYNNRANRK